jgi:hypothetical protein
MDSVAPNGMEQESSEAGFDANDFEGEAKGNESEQDEPAGEQDGPEAKGGRRPTGQKCFVCLDRPAVARSNCCKECRKDVANCKADAAANKKLDVFQKSAAKESTFRVMILKYQNDCPSKGPGRRRDSLDWARLQDEIYNEKRHTIREVEEMMDWVDFEKHHLALGKTAKETAALWVEAVKQDGCDLKGPRDGFAERVPVHTKTQRVCEDIGGHRRSVMSGTKDKKVSVELLGSLQDAISEGFVSAQELAQGCHNPVHRTALFMFGL